MLSISVDAREFKQYTKSIKSNLSNLEIPFNSFGKYMLRETKKQVANEIDPDGNRYAPLSRSTVVYKARKRLSPNILKATGKMGDSYRYRADKKSLEVQNIAPYSAYHQSGTERMPQRRIFGMNHARMKEQKSIFTVWLRGRKSGASKLGRK